jgi:hypothetical protein
MWDYQPEQKIKLFIGRSIQRNLRWSKTDTVTYFVFTSPFTAIDGKIGYYTGYFDDDRFDSKQLFVRGFMYNYYMSDGEYKMIPSNKNQINNAN